MEADAECISLENFLKVNELVLPAARQALAAGRAVIFDGNFYHQGQIEHLLSHLPGPHFVFTLKAPLEVCVERDRHRATVHGEDAAGAVHDLVSRFDYGILIDITSQTEEAVIEMLKTHLSQ